MKKNRTILIAGLFLVFQWMYAVAYCQPGSPYKISAVRLQALDQRSFATTALHKKLACFIFLSPECPLSQNYSVLLNKLAAEHNKDVDIVGVFPGKGYSFQEYKKFKKKYHINFILLADRASGLVKKLSATTTPEAFLLNDKNSILYHGSIDDWAISLGKQRKTATQNYLQDAINNYLAGMPISIKETKPIGCLINDL